MNTTHKLAFSSAFTAAAVALAFGFAPVAHGASLFPAFNDTATVEDLQEQLLDLSDQVKGIHAKARSENREVNDDESAQVTEIFRQFETIEARIEVAQRRTQASGRKTNVQVREEPEDHRTAAQAASRRPSTDRMFASPRAAASGRNGFASTGEFLNAVIKSSAKGAQTDPRLVFNASPTTFGSEGVGQDGGFAVPPDFRAAIMQKVMGEDSLLSLTDQQTSSSNTITFPADETTPWQSSGGIQAYWEVEGGQKTQSRPQLTEKTVKLNKVIALVPLTDELLEDAPAMAGYVNKKAPEKINFKVNDAIINGTGVGMPLGILQSPGTVIIPKESGQAADTILFNNIMKLWSAVTPAARRNARWLLNADVEPQLMTMAFPGAGTAVPAYLPPGGLSAAPYGTLMGRPIVYSEAMPALGDKGDIIFGDLSNYLTAVKSGGIRTDVSIHIWFDYDITAFRFVLRVGGQPWWNAPVTPYQMGSSTRGFFAALAERA
ncbi:phage major capsid protein [Variovorax sp. PvP013]|uniref:phage major capsid protein n=1 Tax=Variovorax sp. PvP013 TaxID=3156435 RepID=UPI003D233D64